MKNYTIRIFRTCSTTRTLIYSALLFMIFWLVTSAGSTAGQNDTLFSGDMKQQQPIVRVKGKVTDQAGKPLEGANVLLMERARNVKTDAKGEFSIAAPIKESLEFSSIGFKSQILKASEKILDVKLKKI